MFFTDFTGFRVVYPIAVLVQNLVRIYSPFDSGDIAAFVRRSQTFEIRETEIFVRGEMFPHMRSVTCRALTRPLKPLARL